MITMQPTEHLVGINVQGDYYDLPKNTMGKMDIRKQDWKLFREKVPEWQELYMEKLLKQYIALLSDESSYASKRFWELDEKIKKDKRTPGVQLQLDKSEMEIDTAHLIIDGAITLDDLSDFSKEFQDTVNSLIERFN